MRKILVLTHGHLATGVKSNADLIMGEFGCAHYIDGYLDGFVGRVDAIEAEKNLVRVTVSMMGKDVPVELEIDQVQPLGD